MPNEGADNLFMIKIPILTHFRSYRIMFRRRWLRPIRGEVNKKMGEANSEKNDIFWESKLENPDGRFDF